VAPVAAEATEERPPPGKSRVAFSFPGSAARMGNEEYHRSLSNTLTGEMAAVRYASDFLHALT